MGLFHYLGWLALGIPAAIQAVRVFRNPREAVAPPTLVTLGFFFLYVVAYLALDDRSRDGLLDMEGYQIVLGLASSACVLFLLGYHLAPRRAPRLPDIRARGTELFAVGLALLAATGWALFLARSGGFLEYYGAPHGAAGAWEETSAYIYNLRLFFFPALYLLLTTRLQSRLSRLGSLALVVLVAFLIADAWWQGSRGSWLRLLIVVVTAQVFLDIRGRTSSRRAFILIPAIALLVVFTPYVRSATHLGATVSPLAVARNVVSDRNPLAGSALGEGNELVVGSALAQSAASTRTLDFGLQWLYPVVGFVPRFIWPGKPYAAEWSVDYSELVFWRQGWLLATGAAPTGIADGFLRFLWISPVVWLPFGLWGGYLWFQAVAARHPITVGHLAAFNIGLLYMITQSFDAAFYAWFYFAFPILFWSRTCGTGE